MLKAPPQHLSPRSIAAAAPHKPAELRDPVDGLAQRRRLGRRLWDAMDGTIERLPRPAPTARYRAPRAPNAPAGWRKKAPRQHAVERQTALQASAVAHWRASRRHPLSKPSQTSMPQRHEYHWTRRRRHRRFPRRLGQQQPLNGLPGAGGSTSRTSTAHSATVASPRACGAAVDTRSRRYSAATASPGERVRAATRHGTTISVTTGWAATVAHT